MHQHEAGVLIEAADDARTRCDVREQQAPRNDGAHPLRQNHRSIGIERAGRGRIPRKAGNAHRNEQYSNRREHISQPRTIARERANQRDRGRGRGARRHCGDGLRERLQGRKYLAPQSIAGCGTFRLRHVVARNGIARFVFAGLCWREHGVPYRCRAAGARR